MEDFVFGTLATEAQRIAHERRLRAGVTHHFARAPYSPRPGQPVQVELTLGLEQCFDRAWLYWSTDDQDPRGYRGVAEHGHALALEKIETGGDTMEWGYKQR